MSASAQDRFATLNGLRFHYREWGSEQAKPLILMHGWTSLGRVWDSLAEAMADRYRVFALDQRGHGESERPREWSEYHVTNRVADIEQFVEVLGLGRITLVGHSQMGSAPCYWYAAAHPERVERLVIDDYGPPLPPTAQTAPQLVAPSTVPQAPYRTVQAFDDPDEFLAEMLAHPEFRWTREDRMRTYLDHNRVQTADGRWTLRFDARLRSPDGLNAPRHDTAIDWSKLEQVACTTLLVLGSDGLFSGAYGSRYSAEIPERMVRVMPDCRVVTIPRAGHSVLLDNPVDYVAAVRPFLLDERP